MRMRPLSQLAFLGLVVTISTHFLTLFCVPVEFSNVLKSFRDPKVVMLIATVLSGCAQPDGPCSNDLRTYMPSYSAREHIRSKCMSDGTVCRAFVEFDENGTAHITNTSLDATRLDVCNPNQKKSKPPKTK